MTEELQRKDAEHEMNMAELLESVVTSCQILEDEHFKNINTMKEAEEQAQTEADEGDDEDEGTDDEQGEKDQLPESS